MDDPYEILGVDKTAASADIRKAYRRKAKKAHPDTGGSAAEMDKLSNAVTILSDPVRRAKFDETGQADASPDNLTTAAINNITALLNSLLMSDREIPDYKRAMSAQFEAKKDEVRRALMPLERAIKRAARIKKRWKRKKKAAQEDFIARAIDWQVERHKEALAKGEHDIRILDRCIEILDGYTFSAEASSPSSLNSIFVNINGF